MQHPKPKRTYAGIIKATPFTELFQQPFPKSARTQNNIAACDTSRQPNCMPSISAEKMVESTRTRTFYDVIGRENLQQQSSIGSKESASIPQHQLPNPGNELPTSTEFVNQAHASNTTVNESSAQFTAYRLEINFNGERRAKFLEVTSNSEPDDCQWTDVASNGICVDMTASFLKSLRVNPDVFSSKDGYVPYEWSKVVLLALYNGADIHGNTNKSIWHSVLNNMPFAIVRPSVRGSTQNCIDVLQLRASKCSTIFRLENSQAESIQPVQNVQIVRFSVETERATMAKFLTMADKNAGADRNRCHRLDVQDNSGMISLDNDGDVWAPLLTNTPVRILHAWEKLQGDFCKRETVSSIVQELSGGMNKSVNETDMKTVIQAAQKFSKSTFAVAADPPVPSDQATLYAVTIDVDNISATFTRRNCKSTTDRKRENLEIFNNFEVLFKNDPNIFDNTTMFNPNGKSLKQMPSDSKKKGPTINPYPKGDYNRIQLPAPIGSEVFKIWIFAPKKMKSFVHLVKSTANKCAQTLVNKHKSYIGSALSSAIEGVAGFRPFDIPGGYMFPICTALCFLEEHPDCTFTIETYNCKKKGFRFQASTENFGDDEWSTQLASKIRQFADTHRSMLKLLSKLDRIAEIQPHLSKMGFGMEFQYKDMRGNSLYSLCKPESELCDRIITYPLAFLPQEMASRLSFLKNGDRIQSYIPAWHQANWRRNNGDREVSNLGLRHCINKGHSGSLSMNVTQLLRGAKKEHIMIDDVLKRFRANFCERVEIATSWSFTHSNPTHTGLGCYNGQPLSQESRWLDLKAMIGKCVSHVQMHTHFWTIDPITDYISLNFAAALAAYHTSARAITDSSLILREREQCCRTMIYVNQLLRVAKDGKLWQKRYQPKLSLLTRGVNHNRELMLPHLPSCVFIALAQIAGITLSHIPTVHPVSPNEVIKIQDKLRTIEDRIRDNRTRKNNYGCRVLRCRTCGMCFYGGRGINDDQMFKVHFNEHPDHSTGPSPGDKISNEHWYFDYNNRETKIMQRYNTVYNAAQKRAYDVVMKEGKCAVLLGIGGGGKTMLVHDLLYLLRCLFWKKDEVHVCGATHAVAQRMENTASTFHSLLGIYGDRDESGKIRWDFSVDECLHKIRTHNKKLKTARIVVLDEGLEVSSNLMEAYFRYIQEEGLNIITIIAGDMCQGIYREDQETGIKEKTFFSDPIKHANLSQTFEIVTFTEDLRTKCVALKRVKEAVRNAVADCETQSYIAQNQYSGSINVEIILCARILDMIKHNTSCLDRNPNKQMIYHASLADSNTTGNNSPLQYKYNGVQHVILLKIGAPIMIMQTYETDDQKKLKNGSLGKVIRLCKEFVTIQIGQDERRIRPVKIFGTNWMQLPLCAAYAGTIAKCIGFEFESIAIDFGLKDTEDGSAQWRAKQAYTAISRAKQHCYFIGSPSLKLLNNMDVEALNFFKMCLNGQQEKQLKVVRDVFEMAEFWVNHTKSRSRVRDESEDRRNEPKRSKINQPIQAKTPDGNEFQLFAEMYPRCFQNMGAKGQIHRATSKIHKDLLLKRKGSSHEKDYQLECSILRACSEVSGVLKLIATTVDRGIVLEPMKDRVAWPNFVKSATKDIKTSFLSNFKRLLKELDQKKIAHRNISPNTLWVDLKGTVKLAWFQDGEYPATTESLQKDRNDADILMSVLFSDSPVNMHLDSSDSGSYTDGTILCISESENVDVEIDDMNDASMHGEASIGIGDEGMLEECCDCSFKCVKLSGNSKVKEKVESPITWLVEACLATNLITSEHANAYQDPEEVISRWDRNVKHSTALRHKTGGGITKANFWPDVLKKLDMQQFPTGPKVFLDFGSEYFLQGLLCALLGDFEEVVGIEIEADTFDKSVACARYLMNKANQENKFMSKVELHFGDFLNHTALLGIMERSTIAYANNVVFESSVNAALVQLWRQHLPACATIVLFDEKAILSSGETRTSRTTDMIDWASRIGTMITRVSWHPGKDIHVSLWNVLPTFTAMRSWAASATLEDLLGWAICNAKALLIHGDHYSSLWQDRIIITSDISEMTVTCRFHDPASSIFISCLSTQDYKKAQQIVELNKFKHRANFCCMCIIDASHRHPIVDNLFKKAKAASLQPNKEKQ